MSENYRSLLKRGFEEIKELNKKLSLGFLELEREEINLLRKKTIDEITSSDPINILEEYFGDIKLKQGKYWFRRRPEDSNASTCMSLYNGKWQYCDFGDSSASGKGDILSLLEHSTSLDFPTRKAYCISKLSLNDYEEIAKYDIAQQNHYIKEQNKVVNRGDYEAQKDRALKAILEKAEQTALFVREQNQVLEKESEVFSRVSSVSKMIPLKYIKMLQDRGIDRVPKGVYFIRGENFKREGKGIVRTSVTEGVGVLTTTTNNLLELEKVMNKIESTGFYSMDEKLEEVKFGGDVHFIPYIDKNGVKRKTQSFGVGGISYWKTGINHKKLFIAESKMDVCVADQLFDFAKNGIDVLIANSTNNKSKVVEFLKNSPQYSSFYNLNQNDVPALVFTSEIMKETGIKKFGYFNYKKEEYKEDINDLHIKGVDLYSRLTSGSLEQFSTQIIQMKELLIERGLFTDLQEKTFNKLLEDSPVSPLVKEGSFRIINKEDSPIEVKRFKRESFK